MAHEEIFRELADCQATGEFVAYHKWGDKPDVFLVGVVRELSPTKVVFQEVDVSGSLEPELRRVPLRLIHTVDRHTHYLWRLRTLHELGQTKTVNIRSAETKGEIRALLEEAAREGAIVRIWTSAHEANDFLVLSIGKETIVASSVLDGGPADGRTLVRLNRIVKVRCGPGEIHDTQVHRFGLENGFG